MEMRGRSVRRQRCPVQSVSVQSSYLETGFKESESSAELRKPLKVPVGARIEKGSSSAAKHIDDDDDAVVAISVGRRHFKGMMIYEEHDREAAKRSRTTAPRPDILHAPNTFVSYLVHSYVLVPYVCLISPPRRKYPLLRVVGGIAAYIS